MGSDPTLSWPGIDDPSDVWVECSLESGEHSLTCPYGRYFTYDGPLAAVYLIMKSVHKGDKIFSLEKFTVQELRDKTNNSTQCRVSWQEKHWGVGAGPGRVLKSRRLVPIFAWLEKFQGLEFITQAKCLRATVSHDPITEFIAQGHLWGCMAILLTLVWDQLTPGPCLFLSQRAVRLKPT